MKKITMKKITLLIALLLLSLQSNAQILASQNFDTALGWTSTTIANDAGTVAAAWSRRTTGTAPTCTPFAGAGMARFNSYNIPSPGTGRLTSPAIAFAGANYRVKFKMYRDDGYPTDADNIKIYYNTVATAGGTLLGTVNRSKDLLPTVGANGWYSYAFNLPPATTGTGYINILGTSAYGNNIFIDEIVIDQIPSNDAELSSVDMSSIVLNGSIPISGALKNNGAAIINTLDINWQIGTETIYTQSLSGLNLSSGQSYAYTHTDQWFASSGTYSLKVWVSNINGGSIDSDATNDQIVKTITVASQAVTRFPLFEKFSSATCPPCATFNGTYFTPFYNSGTNKDNFALIDYQVNWPGTGDPYYTAEVGTRVQYYGINAAPTLLIDSKPSTDFNQAQLQTNLNNSTTRPAYFTLNATKNLVGSDITINVTTTPYLSGAFKMYCAVVEKVTTGNIATNGETSFKDVMMKMLPDASGTSINFVDGVPVTTTLQANLDGLFVEEMTDLEVIVFIQNTADKSIMQTKIAVDALLANNEFVNKKLKLYPNPSTGILKISTDKPVDIIITDITGKTVFTAKQVTSDNQVNVSSLQKGIYIAKILNDGKEQNQKIILK
jgi:Secretion system C-terminal sorting domain/Outer membrane protein Omp28